MGSGTEFETRIIAAELDEVLHGEMVRLATKLVQDEEVNDHAAGARECLQDQAVPATIEELVAKLDVAGHTVKLRCGARTELPPVRGERLVCALIGITRPLAIALEEMRASPPAASRGQVRDEYADGGIFAGPSLSGVAEPLDDDEVPVDVDDDLPPPVKAQLLADRLTGIADELKNVARTPALTRAQARAISAAAELLTVAAKDASEPGRHKADDALALVTQSVHAVVTKLVVDLGEDPKHHVMTLRILVGAMLEAAGLDSRIGEDPDPTRDKRVKRRLERTLS